MKKKNGKVRFTPGEAPKGWRLPTLTEGRMLATAATNGFFAGWRSKAELYRRATALLGSERIGEWQGPWVERRWSAPLRQVAAKADGAGALCGIMIKEPRHA